MQHKWQQRKRPAKFGGHGNSETFATLGEMICSNAVRYVCEAEPKARNVSVAERRAFRECHAGRGTGRPPAKHCAKGSSFLFPLTQRTVSFRHFTHALCDTFDEFTSTVSRIVSLRTLLLNSVRKNSFSGNNANGTESKALRKEFSESLEFSRISSFEEASRIGLGIGIP